jgi:GT2 family glycosyltransferase
MSAFECWANGQLELTRLGDEMEHLSLNGASRVRRVKFGRYVETKKSFEGFEYGEEHAVGPEPIVYFVDSDCNGGFGFGCNVGMRLADRLGSSAYWLLNNDCVVSRDALARVSEAVRSRPKVVFGTVVRFYHHPEAVQTFGGGTLTRWIRRNRMQDHQLLFRQLNFIYGASIAFSSACRSVVGDFDERIFMYFEEIDFCLRASAEGFVCDVVEVDVFHKHGGSQGSGSSVGAWMNVFINKHYVLRKHFGWGAWTVAFYMSLILRCLFPFTGKNASIGAQRALKVLMSKGAPQ